MRLAVLLAIAICLLSESGFAQPSTKKATYKFLATGVGWSYSTVRDQGMSSLDYNGNNINGVLGLEKWRDSSARILETSTQFGFISSSASSDKSDADLFRVAMRIDYIYLKKINRKKRILNEVYLGFGINNLGELRFRPSEVDHPSHYEIISSLSPALLVRRTGKTKNRTIAIDFRLVIPVASSVIRPSFASNLPIGFVEERDFKTLAFFQSIDVASFNHFQRVNVQINMNYPIKNGNYIKIGYEWDFYNYNQNNRVTASYHGIKFSTLFNYKR